MKGSKPVVKTDVFLLPTDAIYPRLEPLSLWHRLSLLLVVNDSRMTFDPQNICNRIK